MLARAAAVLAAVSLLVACGGAPAPLTVIVTQEQRPLVADFFEFVPLEGLSIVVAEDPVRRLPAANGLRVAVVIDSGCASCDPGSYRIDGGEGRFEIHAAGPLGAQYGLAEILEGAGFRFFHPWRSHAPEQIETDFTLERLGELQEPEMGVRGLHLHTLHPIEGYYDFWEPGAQNLEGARRTIDWLVKNRGNYLQYPGLDDIQRSPETAAAWRSHTQQILDYAHRRGVRVGLGVQLFGKSNLQLAFDLLDGEVSNPREEMKARLAPVLAQLAFDEVSLSFGEFSGAEPADFVANVNLAVEVMKELSPSIEINSVIHVGDTPELRVSYQGEALLYYFLVKFADPRIVPYVHSVMYFNLFEDAGGAYHHDDFAEHRTYLVDKLKAGARAAYFPESAYWIAFDNSVPTYLPVYTRSRWLDISNLRSAAGTPLREHTLFSSGWEWGYWQHDYATLRMNFRLPERWEATMEEAFAPWGEAGREVAGAIHQVGEAQHEGLIGHRLAAYVAARDQLIDGGELVGIVSQPDRASFSEVQALGTAERAAFAASVLDPLLTMADAHQQALDRVAALGLEDDPFISELRDGIAVTTARIRFVHALYSAVVRHAGTGSDQGELQRALDQLAAARSAVSRRHAHLHDPDPLRLFRNGKNATVYQYGYLREANSLCFWNRERVQVQRLLFGSVESEPACVL